MKTPICNRDFQHPADGWYQIEVPGEHLNQTAGVVQVIDGAAVESIVNRFNQEADAYQRQHGEPFPGMLIDHEHFKHDPDKETTAYGWLLRLENRNGKPFGQIHWTTTGKAAVDGGDYRFFSSEYDPKDLQILNRGEKPVRARPMRLDGLTLTNAPNNKGGSPITNRAGTAAVKPWKEEESATPELDKWFQAIKRVQKSAATHTGTALDFRAAWELARQQFPDEFAAAFSDGGNPADVTDAQAAGVEVKALANRIKLAAQCDFQFGWDFVRENVPVVYNRLYAGRTAV